MRGRYTLSGGLECELIATPMPGVPGYHVLAATAAAGADDDLEQLASLATRLGGDLAAELFGDRKAFSIILNGPAVASRSWPHAHIVPTGSVSARRKAMVCLFFKHPLRRLRTSSPAAPQSLRVRLEGRWARLLDQAGAAGSNGAAGPVLDAYAEPERVYHGLEHLEAVLASIDGLESAAVRYAQAHEVPVDGVAVRLAGWFHDAVYDPRRGDNEERSARWAEQALGELGVPADLGREVGRLIRVTADHAVAGGDVNGAWLCDADLAVLAGPGPMYQAYVAAVRAEYAHVPEHEWKEGRAAVLDRLLSNTLFTLRADWAGRATENLRGELDALRAGSARAAP